MNPKLPKFSATDVIQGLSEQQGWQLTQTGVPNTWATTKGEGVCIWVIDTGRCVHKDVVENIIGYVNFVPNEAPTDLNGHQTAICGIIAAKQNDVGIVGVAPEAKIFCVKALNKNGSGEIPAIYQALNLAVKTLIGEEKRAPRPDIICMSLGMAGPFPSFVYDLIKKIYSHNVTIICAAGNSGERGIDYPGAYPECIAVGAYDEKGNITDFSGKGAEIDFAGPGFGIVTTWLNDEYKSVKGTSFAAPYVAGVVALMLSKHRKQERETGKNDCKTPAQVKIHLAKYAKNPNNVGHDEKFGFGIIDPYRSVINDDSSYYELPPEVKPKKKSWLKRLLGL